MRTTRRRQSAGTRLAVVALAAPLALVLLGGTASAAPAGPAPAASSTAPSSGHGTKTQPSQQATTAPRAKPETPGRAGTPAKVDKPARTAEPAQDARGRRSGGEHPGASGTASSPQPPSAADRNGTGANPGNSCSHAYCSTRDGSPSGNGAGDGAAHGKPCAGCVGKADNKNPPGQAPDGTDRNNGYECDGNTGIGRTNPAHTGCRTTTVGGEPPAETCPTNPALPGCPPDTTTEVLPRVVVPDAVEAAAPTLVAVLPAAFSAPAAAPAAPAAAPGAPRPTVLPFTGSDVTGLLPLALSLLALGVAMVRGGRRPASR